MLLLSRVLSDMTHHTDSVREDIYSSVLECFGGEGLGKLMRSSSASSCVCCRRTVVLGFSFPCSCSSVLSEVERPFTIYCDFCPCCNGLGDAGGSVVGGTANVIAFRGVGGTNGSAGATDALLISVNL